MPTCITVSPLTKVTCWTSPVDSSISSRTSTASALTSTASTPLWGKLGDQYGRKIVLQIGLVIFLVLWAIAAPHILNFSTDDAQAIKEYRAKGIDLRFVTDTIEGKPIHYAITGPDSLPTLVFIHGSPGSWDAFDPFMKDSALRATFRMVSIDRPGYGGSADAGPMHLQDQSKLIVPVLRSLAQKGPLMLAGHSLGGPMVVQLAADDPKDVACIVLLAGSVSPEMISVYSDTPDSRR